MTTSAFLLTKKDRLLIGQIGMWFVYFLSTRNPVKILFHEKLIEVAGETETKYDTIFKCVKFSIIGFKKLHEDEIFELEVINSPSEHIYLTDKLYVSENLSDDIINNYFNKEVNEPCRV